MSLIVGRFKKVWQVYLSTKRIAFSIDWPRDVRRGADAATHPEPVGVQQQLLSHVAQSILQVMNPL